MKYSWPKKQKSKFKKQRSQRKTKICHVKQNWIQLRTSSLKIRLRLRHEHVWTLTCRQLVSLLINTWVRNWTYHCSSDLHWKHETILQTHKRKQLLSGSSTNTTISSPYTIKLINNWHDWAIHKTNDQSA